MNYFTLLKSKILEQPKIYEFVQWLFAAEQVRGWLAAEYLNGKSVGRILDVGCGTSLITQFIDIQKTYIGLDLNKKYISEAEKRKNVHLWVGGIDSLGCAHAGVFDRIILIGLLHHLSDEQILTMLPTLRGLLAQGGVIVTLDPVMVANSSWFSRLLVALDRGVHVRSVEAYKALIGEQGFRVDHTVKSNPRLDAYRYAIFTISLS